MGCYRIARFPNRGRGLQATSNIPQGTEILRTPCLVLPKSETQGTLAHYLFKWEEQLAVAFGDASLLNHARPANCDYHPDVLDKSIVVVTNRAIREDEELTIDYGWEQPGFVKIGLRSAALDPESESHRCWLLAESQREAGRMAE